MIISRRVYEVIVHQLFVYCLNTQFYGYLCTWYPYKRNSPKLDPYKPNSTQKIEKSPQSTIHIRTDSHISMALLCNFTQSFKWDVAASQKKQTHSHHPTCCELIPRTVSQDACGFPLLHASWITVREIRIFACILGHSKGNPGIRMHLGSQQGKSWVHAS